MRGIWHRACGYLSRLPPAFLACGASALAVLFLFRGLVFGTGGYQLYVDAALPSSRSLLLRTCDLSVGLWSSANLGVRNLYPSEYLICAPINGLIRIGVPAWMISRLLPVLCLVVAAAGMTAFVLRITNHLDPPSGPEAVQFRAAVAAIVGTTYASGPYSVTELIAGHFLYLIAIACVPWAALCLLSRFSRPVRIVSAGAILALALVQTQFLLIVPVVLACIAILLWRRAVLLDGALAFATALVAHLAWIVPLVLYPDRLSTAYVLPGTAQKFAVLPLDAVRQLGYVTPFPQLAAGHLRGVWTFALWALPLLGVLGLLALRTRVVVGLGLVLILTGYVEWSAKAPLGSLQSRTFPFGLQALLRERYSLTYIMLFLFSVLAMVAVTLNSRRAQRGHVPSLRLMSLVGAAVVFVATLPLLNGHLAQYGSHRESFADEERVAAIIDSHGGGTTMTIPLGSIVRGPGWAMLGRNPFSLGGPPGVVDTEGPPDAAADPVIRETANELEGSAASLVLPDLLNMLDVRFVVFWKQLVGDASADPMRVENNLRQVGAQILDDTSRDELWELPARFGHGKRPAVTVAPRILLVSQGNVAGSVLASKTWNAAIATGQGADIESIAHQARVPALVPCCRSIQTTRAGNSLRLVEPIISTTNGHMTGRAFAGVVSADVPVHLEDGTPIPMGTSVEFSLGPPDTVYYGRTGPHAVTEPAGAIRLVQQPGYVALPSILKYQFQGSIWSESLPISDAVNRVQDTYNVHRLTLAQAGIGERTGCGSAPPCITATVKRDEVGLPFELPSFPGTYDLTIRAQATSGTRASASIVIGGRTIGTTTVPIPSTGKWTDVRVSSNSNPGQSFYLYVYARKNGAARTSEPGPVSIASSVLQLRRPMPPAVLQASPGTAFAVSRSAYDRGWHLATVGDTRLSLLGDGYENVWAVANPTGTPAANYVPQLWFRRIELLELGFFAALTVGLVWRHRRSSKVRIRSSSDGKTQDSGQSSTKIADQLWGADGDTARNGQD